MVTILCSYVCWFWNIPWWISWWVSSVYWFWNIPWWISWNYPIKWVILKYVDMEGKYVEGVVKCLSKLIHFVTVFRVYTPGVSTCSKVRLLFQYWSICLQSMQGKSQQWEQIKVIFLKLCGFRIYCSLLDWPHTVQENNCCDSKLL